MICVVWSQIRNPIALFLFSPLAALATLPVQPCQDAEGNPASLIEIADGYPSQFVSTVCPVPQNVIRTQAVCGDIEKIDASGRPTGELRPELLELTRIDHKHWTVEEAKFFAKRLVRKDRFDIDYIITCANSGMKYAGTHSWTVSRQGPLRGSVYFDVDSDNAFDGERDVSVYNQETGEIDVPTYTEEARRKHLKDILGDWNQKRVPVLDLGDQLVVKRLERPVLFLHGMEANYLSWRIEVPANVPGYTERGIFEEGLVAGYQPGSIPDVLATTFGLKTRFIKERPLEGINDNGIYFFNGSNLPHVPDNPADLPPGDIPAAEQAEALYDRLVQVLNRHYKDEFGNSTWESNPDQTIDLVGHSQGGLVVRRLLLDATRADRPTGSANPANHIGRFITLDTPHFGSLMATKINCASSDNEVEQVGGTTYAALGDLLKQLQCPDSFSDQQIAQGTVDLEWYTTGLAAGRIGAGSFPWHPGSAAGAILGFVGGSLWGAVDDSEVEANLKGGMLGPYQLHLDIAGVGLDPIDVEALEPIRKKLGAVQQRHTDLARGAPLIDELGGYPNPYPKKPNGDWIDFLPIYSDNVKGLEAEFISQISGGVFETCRSGRLSNREKRACLDVGAYLSSKANEMLGAYGEATINESNEIMQIWQGVRDGWAVNSDIAVESASQRFEDPDGNTSAEDGNILTSGSTKLARTYVLHKTRTNNPLEKMVPHLEIDFAEENAVTGPITVYHAGAAGMGSDVVCALTAACDERIEAGEVPVLTRATKSHPAIPKLAGLEFDAHEINLNGDFDLMVRSTRPSWKGFRLQHGSGEIVQEIYHNANQLVAYHPDDGVRVLAASVPQQPLRLVRTGNTLTVKAGDLEAFTFESYETDLSLQVFTDGSKAPDVLGSFTPSDPESQIPPGTEGEVQVWYRQAAGEQTQLSRPRLLVVNPSSRPISGVRIVYHFTESEPANPQVSAIRAQGLSWSVESLGEDRYRLVAEAPSLTIPAQSVYPDAEGWEWLMQLGNGTPWNIFDDWSNENNIGIPAPNHRIALYDGEGNLLWGQEPDYQRLEQFASVRLPEIELLAWDAETNNQAQRRPQIRIKNTGVGMLADLSVTQFFKAPFDKALSLGDDYTPETAPVLQELGNGWYAVVNYVHGRNLNPGEEMELGQYRLHTSDWSAWPLRTENPAPDLSEDPEPVSHILVEAGEALIWGSVPDLDVGAPPEVDPSMPPSLTLKVLARDEQPTDPVYVRPRIRIENTSGRPVRGFQVEIPFHVAEAASPLLNAPWYVPGCQSLLQDLGNQDWQVKLHCPEVYLGEGQAWPDPAGAVLGLHLEGWLGWSRTDDPAFDELTTIFAESQAITAKGWE